MINADLDRLAARLRELRAGVGITLSELGDLVHLSKASLSRYLTAQAVPPWQVVDTLAELAGCDRHELRALWEAAAETHRWSYAPQTGGRVHPKPDNDTLVVPKPARQRPAAKDVGVAVVVAGVAALGGYVLGSMRAHLAAAHAVKSQPLRPLSLPMEGSRPLRDND